MPQDCLLRTNWNHFALNNIHSLITPRLTLASILLPLRSEVQSPEDFKGDQDPAVLLQVPLPVKQGSTVLGNCVSEGVHGVNLIINSILFLLLSYSAFPFINYVTVNFHVTGAEIHARRVALAGWEMVCAVSQLSPPSSSHLRFKPVLFPPPHPPPLMKHKPLPNLQASAEQNPRVFLCLCCSILPA